LSGVTGALGKGGKQLKRGLVPMTTLPCSQQNREEGGKGRTAWRATKEDNSSKKKGDSALRGIPTMLDTFTRSEEGGKPRRE